MSVTGGAVAVAAPPIPSAQATADLGVEPAAVPEADVALPLDPDPERAWDVFLTRYSPLVLQVVHLFERDADRIGDCFVFVCERLRRDDLRRIRGFKAGGRASFATWLRVVVRNLCLDWRRARFGRPRLPRAIARLPVEDQEVYRAVHLRGLSENEAVHALRASCPGMTRTRLGESLARIGRSLESRQIWSLLTRRPRLRSLSGPAGGDGPGDAAPDPSDPRVDPEAEAELRETLAAVAAALSRLPHRERLLVRLRFEQDLTLEQIARLGGFGTPAKVERTLRGALDTLRLELSSRGLDALSVEGG